MIKLSNVNKIRKWGQLDAIAQNVAINYIFVMQFTINDK